MLEVSFFGVIKKNINLQNNRLFLQAEATIQCNCFCEKRNMLSIPSKIQLFISVSISAPSKCESISPLDDLAFDMYQDPEVAHIIRHLDRKKQDTLRQGNNERFKNLKQAIADLQKVPSPPWCTERSLPQRPVSMLTWFSRLHHKHHWLLHLCLCL